MEAIYNFSIRGDNQMRERVRAISEEFKKIKNFNTLENAGVYVFLQKMRRQRKKVRVAIEKERIAEELFLKQYPLYEPKKVSLFLTKAKKAYEDTGLKLSWKVREWFGKKAKIRSVNLKSFEGLKSSIELIQKTHDRGSYREYGVEYENKVEKLLNTLKEIRADYEDELEKKRVSEEKHKLFLESEFLKSIKEERKRARDKMKELAKNFLGISEKELLPLQLKVVDYIDTLLAKGRWQSFEDYQKEQRVA